ncbi:unnamed protein product [Oikopleura dioica]|uniref:Sideroflexin-3 n=1 Tax=Oikopleura dioica TaxID=34765 RepID=E4WX55_OIKDI|nr:unnamed protein product [Oikopleura dioica]
MSKVSSSESRLNLKNAEFDQETFSGRVFHFCKLTDPRNALLSASQLQNAKDIVTRHQKGENLGLTNEQLWKAKYEHDSAFHPDTGEKMFLPGRMSFWVPGNMIITGAMLAYQSTPQQVIFWQLANQSVNAVVNYTNRSGDADISTAELSANFLGATTLASGTALGIKKFAPKSMARLSPFFAVCAANGLNTSLMRSNEIKNGIPVLDEHGNELGKSSIAAQRAVGQVIVQRISCAIPAMALPLLGMIFLEKRYPALAKSKVGAPAAQVALVGFGLLFGNPLTCALFKQQSEISGGSLEPELALDPQIRAFYNKGL